MGNGFLRMKQKIEPRKEMAIAANDHIFSSSLMPLAALISRKVLLGIGNGITELGGKAQ
jgi:hypothetical protein